MELSEALKESIAQEIIKNFLEKEDVADLFMDLAIELTESVISNKNQDLFSEISGAVGYKLAEMIKKVYYGIEDKEIGKLPKDFKIDVVKLILQDRRHVLLANAFSFDTTPQGFSHWYVRYKGFTALNKEDMDQLERWVEIAEAHQKGDS